MTDLIKRAAELAKTAHESQEYAPGVPYFEGHVEKVVLQCFLNGTCTEKHIVAAYLHDVVEDCPSYPLEYLTETLKLDSDIVEAVKLLSKNTAKKKGTSEFEYLLALSLDPLALAVKIADAQVNSRGGRAKYKITVPLLESLRDGKLYITDN